MRVARAQSTPGRRRGRGLARFGAAAIAAALAVSAFAPAARADVAEVTVVTPGGARQTLALEALAGSEDVVNRTYALRSAAGESPVTVSGFSPGELIEAAGVDPYAFSYLEVQRPSGGTVQLSRHQALDPGAFPEGPAVLYATAAGTGFLRPATGPEDLNANDSFEAPQGIALVLRKGSPLEVSAKASAAKVEVGEKVSFSAVVAGAGAGEQLKYSWYFDDGNRTASESPTHKFSQPGSYDVVLGVTTAGDSTGASAVVRVQVGEPISGPNRKGGGRNESKDAPDHGAAAGPSEGSSGGALPGSGSIPPVPSAGAAPTPVPSVPTPIVPTPTPAPAPQPAAPEAAKPDPKPQPEPTGVPVEGELVAAETSALPTPEERQAEARRGNLDGDGGGGGVPGAVWGGLAFLGLLGLGGLLEARGLTSLVPHFRRGGMA